MESAGSLRAPPTLPSAALAISSAPASSDLNSRAFSIAISAWSRKDFGLGDFSGPENIGSFPHADADCHASVMPMPVVALATAAARLMRAYSVQVETLRRLRHGGDQYVRVEHVHVNDGGQAVIGNGKTAGSGDAARGPTLIPHANARPCAAEESTAENSRIARAQRQRSDSSGGPGLLISHMQTKDQPKDGRSPGYSAEIAETICERLINGESLRAICADPRMPAKATVFRWLASNQEFRRSYALARECQAEDLAFEILEIADDGSGDYVKKTESWKSDLGLR